LDRAGSQFNYNVVVYASADKSGSAKTNEVLRNKRAESVKKFLVSLGVNVAKISVVTSQPAYTVANNLDRRAVVGVTVNK
jgi:outer membrane protein OmpA-like peptidoglycan-associated protein